MDVFAKNMDIRVTRLVLLAFHESGGNCTGDDSDSAYMGNC